MIAFVGCNHQETYIVTFDANGGTGTMQQQVFTEGEQQALTRNAFSREDYSFSKWNTMQDCSGTSYTDGQTITVSSEMILYAQWAANDSQGSGSQGGSSQGGSNIPANGQLNGHEWVNLGLPSGTLWATCNIGATNPEDYGDYFAWGETTPKETYNWDSYRYCYNYNGTFYFTKYCYSPYMGYPEHFTDSLATLEASDDAATVNWGTGWRTPTWLDFEELIYNCTIKYWTQNWIKGIMVTSNSNGNTIFLPFAGLYNGDQQINETAYGEYMSSSVIENSTERFSGLETRNSHWEIVRCRRCYGFSVRPICTQ